MSDRRLAALASLALVSLLAVGLVGARVAYTGSGRYLFLVWNLFLAWIPFALALALYDGQRRGRRPVVLGTLAGLWLLFFPNAPYILTDFIHLAPVPPAPLWYDALTIAASAFTGLLLGFASLHLVQVVVRRAAGALAGWAAAVGAITLASVGIYVGRFLHLNSWDVFTRPGLFVDLARVRLADPTGNARLLGVTVLFTAFLSVAYAAVYGLAGLRAEVERD